MSRPIVTLTTDFGTADGYVGALKGVILSIAPQILIVDITHDIPPQNVGHAAHALATAASHFPTGTVHLAVVDPGVGGERQAMALATPQAFFVGPDNGLFTPFLDKRVACVALTNPAYHRTPASYTFHGRDIFAPVAAHLAKGVPLADLGTPLPNPLALPALKTKPKRRPDGGLEGQVAHVDRFGNLVTNIRSLAWHGDKIALEDELIAPRAVQILVEGGQAPPLSHSYVRVPPGHLVAYIGSGGALEIGLRDGNAAQALGLGPGAAVVLKVRRLAETPAGER